MFTVKTKRKALKDASVLKSRHTMRESVSGGKIIIQQKQKRHFS